MIRVDVVDSMPIYVIGLEVSLVRHGVTVRPRITGPDSGRADVFLVNPDAVGDDARVPDFVAGLTSLAPVLLLVPWPPPPTLDACLARGARGVIHRAADATTVLAAVRTVVESCEC